MKQEQIVALTCKKHIKIYKLSQLALSNKQIAEAVGTNTGHVYNVLKDYLANPHKVEKANLIS